MHLSIVYNELLLVFGHLEMREICCCLSHKCSFMCMKQQHQLKKYLKYVICFFSCFVKSSWGSLHVSTFGVICQWCRIITKFILNLIRGDHRDKSRCVSRGAELQRWAGQWPPNEIRFRTFPRSHFPHGLSITLHWPCENTSTIP